MIPKDILGWKIPPHLNRRRRLADGMMYTMDRGQIEGYDKMPFHLLHLIWHGTSDHLVTWKCENMMVASFSSDKCRLSPCGRARLWYLRKKYHLRQHPELRGKE